MDLLDIRADIDRIDENIVKLLNQRMNCCLKIAEFKKQNKAEVFNSARESEIFENIKNGSDERFKLENCAIFSSIISVSKFMQYDYIQDWEDDIKLVQKKMVSCFDMPSIPSVGYFGEQEQYIDIISEKFELFKTKSYSSPLNVLKEIFNNELDFGFFPLFVMSNELWAFIVKNGLCVNEAGFTNVARGEMLELNASKKSMGFVIISKKIYLKDGKNTISILIKVPNKIESLYNVLMYFNAKKVEILKIKDVETTVSTKTFNIIFRDDLRLQSTMNFINILCKEASEFNFLGYY